MITTTTTLPAVNVMLGEQIVQLRHHLVQCQAARGLWFSAAVVAEGLHQLLAPRFVTTVVLVGLVLALVCGWV